jgi:hypothetical protein
MVRRRARWAAGGVLAAAVLAAVGAWVWTQRTAPAGLSVLPFDDGLPRSGQWRDGFALADLNADGALDWVHGPARKGPPLPAIFLGDGRGHWRAWDAAFPPLPYDYGDAAVAELDGDGRPDLALAVHLRGVVGLFQVAPGRFEAHPLGLGPLQDDAPFSSRALAAVDWDRDGKPDLLALSDGPRLGGGAVSSGAMGLRLLSRRSGTWTATRMGGPPAPGAGLFGDALAVGDVDGDGHPDALCASNTLGLRTVLLRGDGEAGTQVALPSLPPRAVVKAVALGDLDGGGRPELVLTTARPAGGGWEGRLWVVSGKDLTVRASVALGSEEGTALAVGDFDADGKKDVALGEADGTVRLWRGEEQGGLEPLARLPPPAFRQGCRAYHLEAAEADGRPGAELFAGFAGEASGTEAGRVCPSGGALAAWRFAAHGPPVTR